MLRCSSRSLATAVVLAILFVPKAASAGDCQIFVVGDWGIGKIDGHLMLYVGPGRYLDTPIPAPPEGPRWDVVYRTILVVTLGACAMWLHRRRRPSNVS